MSRVASFEHVLAELRAEPAYQNYLTVREHVLRMKSIPGADDVSAPSGYWSEELENIDYLLDASPLVIRRLRHHCHHVTGIRVYDYRSGKESFRRRIEEKLALLVERGGPELLVSEPPELGGFGFELEGGLYNLDTLKFYEVLVAMERGEVLAQFRRPGERRVAVEIGSGWGGFAYQFKTLFPATTYVIVDLPELFVFSATYLMTLFPDARVSFWGDPEQPDPFASDPDLVFVPNTALSVVEPPRVDLTLNMVSFQEMTTEQVRSYVAWAHTAGSPYLYSLNRDRSGYNPELTSVRELMAERFWLHEIEVLPMGYGTMVDEHRKRVERARKKGRELVEKDPYRHVIGWRRLDVER